MRIAAWLTPIVSSIAGLISAAAWSGPLVVEESARLQSPDPQLPLNGPVAIEGNTLAASSIVEVPEDGDFRCVVFVFERPGATGSWTFVRTLTDFNVPGDRAESFLDLDTAQNVILVSARDRASVFERTATGWTETVLARQPGLASDFGAEGAVTPEYAVVSGTFNGSLAAFVYRRSTLGQWPFEARIIAAPAPVSDNDYLGERIDADGDLIVIPAPDDVEDPDGTGSTLVYRRAASGAWSLSDSIVDPYAPAGPRSGAHVRALAFAPGLGLAAVRNLTGGVTLFVEDNPDSWVGQANIRPLDAGGSVGPLALNRSPGTFGVATAAPFDDDRGAGSGSASVFTPRGDFEAFSHVVKFLASDAEPNLRLATQMDFNAATLAAIGAGRLYVFELPDDLTQPTLLQDDFEDGNSAGWRQSSANWTVVSSRGSRVYRQNSTSGEHVATRTDINWTNVAIEADVRPTAFNGSDRWVSLMARHSNDQNYYYVALRNTNVLRLAKRVGNSFTTLATTSLPVPANRSYRVRLEAVGTWLRVYVDGALRLQARDSTHRRGSVGFKTAFARAEFDNVVVSPNPATVLLTDDFEDSGSLLRNWTTTPAANWSIVDPGNGVLRQDVASGTARAVAGVQSESMDLEDADQIVTARVRPTSFNTAADPRAGVMARYRNDANYVSATLHRNGFVRLRQTVNGATRIVDAASFTVSAGTPYALRLEAVGDRLRVYVNNVFMLEGRDTALQRESTRFGLLTAGAAAEFDDVRVTQP